MNSTSICPYCNSEQEVGYLRVTGGGYLYWSPALNKTKEFLSRIKKIGGIIIHAHSACTTEPEVKAYCCKKCKKITIDYIE